MHLLLMILSAYKVVLHVETAHLPFQKHQLHQSRYQRDVPFTSYGGYSPGPPPAASRTFFNPVGTSEPSFQNQPNQGDGSYSFSYANDNGIDVQERGYLKESVPEGPGTAAVGYFVFISPEGEQIDTSYTADENGYVPQGAHLPTAPPIPPEILQALEKNAADEAAGIFDDGRYHGGDGVGSGGAIAAGARGFAGTGIGTPAFKG